MLKCSLGLTAKPTAGSGFPLWVDPRAVMAVSAFRLTEVSYPSNVETLIAPPDPKRIALGFSLNLIAATGAQFWPAPSSQFYGWQLAASSPPLWFSLFEFGPLVTQGWYSFAANQTTLTLMEWYSLR